MNLRHTPQPARARDDEGHAPAPHIAVDRARSTGPDAALKIRARDITLHRAQPTDTSCSNHLRGRITQIMLAGEHGTYGAVGIELDRALDADSLQVKQGSPLWAMLTRKSIQQMGWAPGQPVVVGFKAMATTVSSWR